jgi:hypothetical protein
MLPRVCIPSYNRPELLKSKSLAFLEQSGYPSNLIFIFVSDKSEFERYQTVCPGYQMIVGLLGLKSQRKFISDWLSEDEIYLGMDDDIDNVKTMGKSFLELVSDGVSAIQTRQTGLWGIMPSDNGMCFQDNTSDHLVFILGALFIARNHQDINLEGACETDDYERSMIYFVRYGKVLRYRGAGVKTKYQGTSGGQTGFRERKREAVLGLIERFPKMCKYRDKRGEADLLLNWRYKICTGLDVSC